MRGNWTLCCFAVTEQRCLWETFLLPRCQVVPRASLCQLKRGRQTVG